jgi:hypothetical protein
MDAAVVPPVSLEISVAASSFHPFNVSLMMRWMWLFP